MISVLKRVARVPDEYQEVEYIESTETQFIDTGFSPDENTRVEYKIRFSQNQTIASAPIMGARLSSNDNGRFLVIAYDGTARGQRVAYGLYNVTQGNIDFNLDYEGIFDAKNNTTTINGTTYALNNNKFTKVQNNNFYIFATSGYPYSIYNSRGRAYYCKIYDNETLIRNFIPCYRKSDNVIGMYDLVNSVFYTNAGTGTFLKGGDIAPSYTVERQRINVLEMTLPKEYQQVEYIESTGTQYINTNIIPSNVDTVEVKVALTNITDGVKQYFAGTRNLNAIAIGYSLYFTVHNGVNYYALSWTNDSAGVRPSLNEIFTTKTEFKNGSTKFYYNGQLRDSSGYTQREYDSGNVIFIGAIRNYDGSPGYISYARYYGIKFSKNGVFVRDLIPCYRKSDNEIGMFDLVSGTFFTNSGTGTFAKGDNVALPIKRVRACLLEPVLPSAYQQVEYIESTGTQYIDTGYKPNGNTKIEIKYQTPTQSTTQQGIFGARNGSLVNAFLIFTGSSQNALQADYYNSRFGGSGAWKQDISGFDGRAINTIEMSNYLKLNGNLIDTLSPTTFQTDSNLYLFAVAINSSGGLNSTLMTGSLWYCKLWDNGTLVRNFIPCYRKSDSVVGLYDIVTKTFFTNSGTGSFSKGADATKYNIIKL